MPKMVCVNCQVEFKPETNGTKVFEMWEFGIYKIWSADTWKCPGCGFEVVAGFGTRPISEHFKDGFKELVERIRNSGDRIEYDYERPTPKQPPAGQEKTATRPIVLAKAEDP